MEVVKFVSAKPYLYASDEVFDTLFFCLHGRKEVVVECSDELKQKLRALPSEFFTPRLSDIKKYLDSEGINYSEDFAKTTTI